MTKEAIEAVPLVSRWRHAGIGVTDMEKSLHFYCGLLGLKLVVDLIEKEEYLTRLIGVKDCVMRTAKVAGPDGIIIELVQFISVELNDRPKSVYNIKGPNHIAFTVEDIGKIYRKLTENGVKFISEPLGSPYDPVKTCFCYDPDDTLVQFVEITDKDKIRKGLG
jgi:catechol 2,3-dioxygenase-like lactoylglutathione lyase family enzyme